VHFCYFTDYKREKQGGERRVTVTISSGQSIGERLQTESSGQASPTYNCLKEFNIVIMMQHLLKTITHFLKFSKIVASFN